MKRIDACADRLLAWLENALCSDHFDRICLAFLCVFFGWMLGFIQIIAR
jgi:hypothetical protein